MISSYQLKTGFQKTLRPIAVMIHRLGITPNQITLFTMLLSLIYSLALFLLSSNRALFLTVPLFYFFRMMFNAIDGLIAKETNQVTPLGTFLNELCDVISDTALFAAFVGCSHISPLLLFIFIFFSILVELTANIAVQIGAFRRYEGPMGKSDRAILMGIISILVAINYQEKLPYQVLMFIGIGGAIVTIYNRIRASLYEIRKV